MRINQHNYISSQQSPYILPYERKYRESLYSRMFLEDFTGLFSSAFTPIEKRDCFYTIIPEDDPLKKLLQFNSFGAHDYNFDTLLSRITYYLIINGKTYVEIVPFMDQENTVKGIEFVCVPAKCHYIRGNKYRLTARSPENKRIQFDIDLNRLVIFDLKNLGFRKNYFRKIINHLSVFDVTNATTLMLNPKMNGIFNFEEYQKAIEYKLLKDTKAIHWLGRNYSNQHLSESYQLNRTMQWKILRCKFLKYILLQINNGLNNFKTQWGFAGNISASVSLSHYKDAFEQYSKGEINASKLCGIVVENLISEV